MALKFRPADYPDLPQILGITERVIAHLDSLGIQQWDNLYPAQSDFEQDIDNQTLFVALQKDAIMGCICLDHNELEGYDTVTWSSPSFLVIHRMLVDPRSQGTGVGRRLVAFGESVARSRSIYSIRLDCFKSNPGANALYSKLGYIPRGEIPLRMGTFILYEKQL